MFEALEKLREIAEKLDDAAARMSEHGFSPIAVKTSLLCDEIEAEIAEAREITRKKHQTERVYWHNELHKILDTINGQKRFWGDCMDYPLPEATIPPSEIAKRMLAERYMLLPVDADGVPIHVGDEMTCHGDVFKVCAVAPAKIHRWVTVKLGEPQTTYSYDPKECTHYKPRTIEDVLRDVWKEALDYAKSDMWRNPDEVFLERATEIRELLDGDAE